MTPATAVLILQIMVKYGPVVAQAARDLLSKNEPSKEDFQKVFDLAQEPWKEMKEENVKPS